jgi:hypothetical protein
MELLILLVALVGLAALALLGLGVDSRDNDNWDPRRAGH